MKQAVACLHGDFKNRRIKASGKRDYRGEIANLTAHEKTKRVILQKGVQKEKKDDTLQPKAVLALPLSWSY